MNERERKQRTANQQSQIMVSVTEQENPGLSEANITLEQLKRLEQAILQEGMAGYEKELRNRGFDPVKMKAIPASHSYFVSISNRRLAVVELTLSYGSEVASVTRVISISDRIVSVGCGKMSPERVSFHEGECGKKVEEVFKVRLSPAKHS